MLVQTSLLRAIKICTGKQKNLAELIGVHPDKISYWLNRAKRVPFEMAIAIEAVTMGTVSRYDLAPYARFYSQNLDAEPTKKPQHKISAQVILATQLEQSIGKRQGARSDLQLRAQQPGSKCSPVKGKTSDLAAKQAGFTSRDSYMRAKKVMQQGVNQLIEVMDQKKISIAQAAAIAALAPSEQETLLLKNKQEIAEYFKHFKKTKVSNHDPIVHINLEVFSLIKNDFLFDLEKQTSLPLRLPLIGLVLSYGELEFFPWEPSILKEQLLPHTLVDFEKILAVLEKYHLIERIYRGDTILGKVVKGLK